MKAIVVKRGGDKPVVIDKPRPEPEPGEALVRTLRVGVDGTDHEVISGGHGGFPEGEDHLVLGHEAVGIVVDPNDTELEEGDIVVPTVRRPPQSGTNEYFEHHQPDMAPDGMYAERGIVGEHGFMSDFFTSPEEYLVRIPRSHAELGFLIEPISITEKALELAYASRSSFEWDPSSALVLGNGSLGLLTMAMLKSDDKAYERLYCLGRRDRPDPTIDIIEKLGGTYIDSRQTPVEDIPDEHEQMDFIYEATGFPKHAIQSVQALAPNGVGALLGVPSDWEFEVDAGAFHREMVLHNKALVGSVNSHVKHFESATVTFTKLPRWFLRDLVTGVYPLSDFEAAFDDDDTTIKTAIEFSSV
ncbi:MULTISPECIES: glucose 1-dehydrogenase [Haloferax]|uniref:Glucose 1-dehydrogenase n=2 Tax=Haloferax TaxID=2251 RepID=A0A6G1Z4Y3_9EURY|nr:MULTISPECIES: glucose 1-dehydrogenase [Haloferax]KAB1188846.1 glucose 1-dehydrogenase [Haloferax sp. CBA1149]MRW81563.1 alcohol dehydrogenase catalytic domain-containing protein [Haloferax marinisediminis]